MKREKRAIKGKTIICSFIFVVAAGIWYLSEGSTVQVEENFLPVNEAVVTENVTVTPRIGKELEEHKKIYCYICGAVKNPGVYECLEGARLVELVKMAGGFTKNAKDTYLNLARMVSDSEQIYVPTRKEAEEQMEYGLRDSTEGLTKNMEDKVNINTADIDKLTSLPGIGQAKAKSICSYREEHGAFQSIEELKNVEGIKNGVYNKVKDLIAIQ